MGVEDSFSICAGNMVIGILLLVIVAPALAECHTKARTVDGTG